MILDVGVKSRSVDVSTAYDAPPPINGSMHIVSAIMHSVMASAAKAKVHDKIPSGIPYTVFNQYIIR